MKLIFRLLALFITAFLAIPSPAQTPDWQWARAGRGADRGTGRDVATDTNGNVFVTGYFEGTYTFGATTLSSPGGTDMFLAKYDSTGRVLWAKQAGGFQPIRAEGLGVDKLGNVYVAGSFQGTAVFDGISLHNPGRFVDDLFIAKYSNAGALLWVKQVGNADVSEGVNAVSADANGGVYVSGWIETRQGSNETQTTLNFGSVAANIPGAYGTFLVRYDAEGNAAWVRANTNSLENIDFITSLASDPAGNVYFTGYGSGILTLDGLSTGNNVNGNKTFAFSGKFNPQGKIQWLTGAAMHGDASLATAGLGIAVDQQENAYVAGALHGIADFGNNQVISSVSNADLFLARYDRNGVAQWVRNAANACAATEQEFMFDATFTTASVCMDGQGRPTVAGSFKQMAQFGNIQLHSLGDVDVYVAQYDPEGNARWARAAGGVAQDKMYNMAFNGTDKFYVTGGFTGTARFGGEVLTSGASASNVFTARVAPCPDQNPVITPSATAICRGDAVLLRVNTLPGQTYQWKKDGVLLAGATADSYTTTEPGSYTVQVQLRHCTVESAAVTLNVDERPTAALLDAAPATVCAGDSLALRARAVDGATYQWLRNNTVVAGATAPLWYARTAGSYRVVVRNAVGCRDTSAARSLVVNPLPDATVAADGSTLLCQTDVATLSANTGLGLTYQWLLNGTPVAGATAATLQARQLGNYAVIVTNAAGCSRQSNALSVVDASITAAAESFCPGDSVRLTANAGAGLSYAWYRDDVLLPGATAATLYASTAGDYTVRVRNASGCSATSLPVIVQAAVVPNAPVFPAADPAVCQGDSVELSTTTLPGLVYQWRRNGVPIAGATGSTLRVKTAGNYSVVVATARGCTVLSAARRVTFTARPGAFVAPAGPVALCAGEPVLLQTDPAPGLRYQWRKDNADLPGATGNAFTATEPGSYAVMITNAGGCAQQSAPTLVRVNPRPAAAVQTTGPLTRCEGDSVLLSAPAGSGRTLRWFRNGEGIAGATGERYYAKTSGSYTLRVDNGTCTAVSGPVPVAFVPNPVATATLLGPSAFCPGDSAELRAGPAPGVTYQWKKDGVRLDGAVQSSYQARAAGRYTLETTNAAGCTSTSEPLLINLFELPATGVTATGSTRFCRGDSVRLSAAPAGGYQWFRNDTLLAGATGKDCLARLPGSYVVRLTGANGCQVRSVPTVVATDQPPVAAIVPPASTSFCTDDFLALRAVDAPGSALQWQRNDQDIPGATGNVLEVRAAGAYRVKVTSGTCTTYSAALAVAEKARLAKPVIQQRRDTLLAAGEATRYQWYLDGVAVSGATQAQWTGAKTGSYTLEVENAGGCRTTSDPFVLAFDCQPLVYPNPFTHSLVLEAGNAAAGKITIRVYNAVGQLMLFKETEDSRLYYRETFLIGAWARGLYLVEVESCGRRTVRRMFKN